MDFPEVELTVDATRTGNADISVAHQICNDAWQDKVTEPTGRGGGHFRRRQRYGFIAVSNRRRFLQASLQPNYAVKLGFTAWITSVGTTTFTRIAGCDNDGTNGKLSGFTIVCYA